MNCKLMRLAATGIFALILGNSQAFGQDLLASQAPIDRELKAVDSVSLQRFIQTEAERAGMELYGDSWNNRSVHCYSSTLVPDSFKIDLRGFAMPTTSRRVTSGFGYRPRFGRMHRGIDVKVYTGDPIYAAFDGKVRIVRYEAGGYGNYVVIRHKNGLETVYAHLSQHLVKVNDEVKAGQTIGLGGNTGRSFGSHLHFETRLMGEAINPALLFDFAQQDVTQDFFVYHKSKKQKVKTAPASNTKALATTKKATSHYYKVRKGDTVATVARRLGISVSTLCANNNLKKNSKLRANQILKY